MELKEFKADMINCLTTKESTYFVSNKKMGRDENDEEYQKILKKLNICVNKQKVEFYKKEEKNRVEVFIKKLGLNKNQLENIENQRKSALALSLINSKSTRSEFKTKYYKQNYLYINRCFLDLLESFLKLDNGGIINKRHENLLIFKEVSELFINNIDNKIIEKYKKGEIVSEKFIFFLELHQMLK